MKKRPNYKVRAAKSKGSQLEMDVEYSLQQKYEDAYRTKATGYIMEYDIESRKHKIVVECKRLKSLSWNQAKTFFEKVCLRAPPSFKCYLIFKSNNQPCLVMHRDEYLTINVKEFSDVFSVPFMKHPPTKKVHDENN